MTTKPPKIEFTKNGIINPGEFEALASLDDRTFKVFAALILTASDQTGEGFTSLGRILELLSVSPEPYTADLLRELLTDMLGTTVVISLTWLDDDAFTFRIAPRTMPPTDPVRST